MNDTSNVPTHLGQISALPASPGDALLETVPWFNPMPDATPPVVRYTCPEFTSLCPVTGQPDFAHFVIDYIPNERLIESKALKLFMGSFRNHQAFHETTSMMVAQRCFLAACPQWLRVIALWYPRGGIPIDIFWQSGIPPAGVVLPEIHYMPFRGR